MFDCERALVANGQMLNPALPESFQTFHNLPVDLNFKEVSKITSKKVLKNTSNKFTSFSKTAV